jgi:hypothetical protein
VKPEAFRLLAGQDQLADYQFSPESSIHHPFCRRCGVRTHGYGDIPEFIGPFVSVKLACLDGVPAAELASAPVQYCDGRADNWWSQPAEIRHL